MRFPWPWSATPSMSQRPAVRAVAVVGSALSASSASSIRPGVSCSPRSAARCTGHGASTVASRERHNYFEVIRVDGENVRGGRVTNLPLAAGDLVRVVTGNGGGWGDPQERERDLILEDLRDEYITPDVARDVYGVDVDLSSNRKSM